MGWTVNTGQFRSGDPEGCREASATGLSLAQGLELLMQEVEIRR